MVSNHWHGLALAAAVAAAGLAVPAEAAEMTVGIVSERAPPPAIYDQDPVPEDDGIAGGRLALRDSNTTGRLVGMTFKMEETLIDEDEDVVAAVEAMAAKGIQFIVLNVPAEKLLKASDAVKGRDILLFNAGAHEDVLRNENCRDNVMHTAPSRAMLTDALAQFLVWKRWRNWLVVYGPHPKDLAYRDQIQRAAKKFAAKIVAEKEWPFGPDGRRTAQQEVPLLTQNLTYDVIVVADETGEFGDYVQYHTWDPRPAAGTHGLSPASWHPFAEDHAGVQLNDRFKRLSKRPMSAIDYNVWMAVRTVTEAAPRIKSTDYAKIVEFVRAPGFELAAFKGVGLSYRNWDWQLRQPILLSQPNVPIAMSPQAGFLHQRTPMDSMGTDQPETKCKLK